MTTFDDILRDTLAGVVPSWVQRGKVKEQLNLLKIEFAKQLKPIQDEYNQLDEICRGSEQQLRQIIAQRRVSTGDKQYMDGAITVQDRKVIPEYDQSPDGEAAQWVREYNPDWMVIDWQGLQNLPAAHPLIQTIYQEADRLGLVIPDWKEVEKHVKKEAGNGWINPHIPVEIKPTPAFNFDNVLTEIAIRNELDQAIEEE